MSPHETAADGQPSPESQLHQALAELRENVHAQMKDEFKKRLETNPKPSEEELRAAAFKEWIEPQVREAALEMLRKGYATKSSGFYGVHNEFQAIDGYFIVDTETVNALRGLGVNVLRGPELGLPENHIITQMRFYPTDADIQKMKGVWDAAAALLPKKDGPAAICDRAEEFREQYAPDHPSFENEITAYLDGLRAESVR